MKAGKCTTTTNPSQKVLGESGPKSNEIWIDQGSKFYNRPMNSCLYDNGIEVYSTCNEGKSTLKLLRDLSEPWRTRFTSAWMQYQKCVHW